MVQKDQELKKTVMRGKIASFPFSVLIIHKLTFYTGAFGIENVCFKKCMFQNVSLTKVTNYLLQRQSYKFLPWQQLSS